MTKYLSKSIDKLVDTIDALIVMRCERMDLRGAEEAVDQLRINLADAITDLVVAAKED
jgi:hypothetical protein